MDEVYKKDTRRSFKYLYTEIITEMLLSKYYCSYEDETKENILSEVIGLKYFTKKEIDIIFDNAIKLLEIKYNIQVINLVPIEFKNLYEK